MKRALQVTTGLVLAGVASFVLFNEADAHVTMCMVSAIGYSIFLIINKPEDLAGKLASFFAGGVLFYTIYTGSTMMYFEWFKNFLWEPGSWIYHILINPAILVLMVTKKDRVEWMLRGLEINMITSPVLLVIHHLTGRRLWDWEGPRVIILYVVSGVVLLGFHQFVRRKRIFDKILKGSRLFITGSLVFYTMTIIAMIPFSKGVNRHEPVPNSPHL